MRAVAPLAPLVEAPAALDPRRVARRGAIRGFALGAFLVLAVFALRPLDPDWAFHWRELALLILPGTGPSTRREPAWSVVNDR